METEGCIFPEELRYTADMNLWLAPEEGRWRVGMTSALLWTAGKPLKVRMKEKGTIVEAGKSIGSVESPRFFDTMRVPFACTIEELNGNVAPHGGLTPRSIYQSHWLARVSPVDATAVEEHTLGGEAARKAAFEKVAALRIHCFSELPDAEMVEIGSECSAVLSRLSGLMENREKGFAVHLVTDDITSPIEMVRWADETGNRVTDTRKIDGVYHFLALKS